jgi:two-component system chemotaxis response regulator CheY
MATSHPPKARVLVVDDEDDVRTMLRDILQQAGYAVVEARSGLEAVEHYRAAPTNVVVLDLLMPGQSGLGTIQELRRHDPAVKIIAISGGGPSGAIDLLPLAESYGARRTLHKPFPIDALVGAVAAVLRE